MTPEQERYVQHLEDGVRFYRKWMRIMAITCGVQCLVIAGNALVQLAPLWQGHL